MKNTSNAKILFNIYPSNGQAGNIYSPYGISPTLMGYAAGGGGKEVKVLVIRKDFNYEKSKQT